MKKVDWLIILFIILASVFTLKDLFKPGLYTSHDGIHQVVRLYYFDQALRDGQFPPRWAGGLLNGFGYPLFIFSYHLPWLIAEPIHLSGLSIIDSVKMTFLAGFILSGIFMYFYQREMFGRIPGFTGMILYLYAPYRFSNIFVRAAIGDATAFIFPPLLFLAFWKIRSLKVFSWKWVILGGLSLAGILLSHAMVFLFFFITSVAFIIYSLIFFERKTEFIKSSIAMLAIAFGISSYYLIPSFIERNYTVFSEIMKVYIENTFLNIKDLLYSPWGYGMMHAKEGGMSFQIGIAQWLVIILSLFVLINILFRKKIKKINKYIIPDSLFFLLIIILSVFAMLPVSSYFWKLLQSSIVIDFSWRILPVTVFFISVLSGFVMSQVKFSWLVGLLLIAVALYANRNHIRINKTLDWPLSFLLQLEKTTNSNDEYTPKWVKKEFTEKSRPKVEFSSLNADVNVLKNTSNYLNFEINAREKGTVTINTIYYPGWQVTKNGAEVNVDYMNKGLMEFPVNEGKTNVIARFTETPVRLISNFISFSTIIFSSIVLLWKRKK